MALEVRFGAGDSDARKDDGVPSGLDDLEDFSADTNDTAGFHQAVAALFDGVALPGKIETVSNPSQKRAGMPGLCGRVTATGSQKQVTQSARLQCPADRFTQNTQRNVSAVLTDIGCSREFGNPFSERGIRFDLKLPGMGAPTPNLIFQSLQGFFGTGHRFPFFAAGNDIGDDGKGNTADLSVTVSSPDSTEEGGIVGIIRILFDLPEGELTVFSATPVITDGGQPPTLAPFFFAPEVQL